MSDKKAEVTEIEIGAATEANQDLGNVKLSTGESLLSSPEGAKILNKYESGMKDGLTGLLNKTSWGIEAKRFFEYSARKQANYGIIYVDVNDFKTKINDAVSHQFGDEVLKLVSSAIVNSIRDTDVAGRLGGDEFAVGLPDVDENTIKEIEDRVSKNLSELVEESPIERMREVGPTVTIGSSTTGSSRESFEELLNRADERMKELKKAGKYGR